MATVAALLAALPAQVDRLTGEVLLCHVLERERSYLYAHPEAEVGPVQATRFAGLIERRLAGEPRQYLTGWQEFYGREFAVNPTVLIPRPETELVVQAALARLPTHAAARVADVGTGSGCIAITLALERPGAEVVASDRSEAALAVARANAARLGARVRWAHCDLLEGIEGRFDVIVSNPPYIGTAEFAGLQREVREHEPRAALLAGATGAEVYARLIPQALRALEPGGWLVLELGYDAGVAVRRLLGGEWGELEWQHDLQGWERVVAARAV